MSTEPEVSASILWRGFAFPGHEACRLFMQDSGWHLEGAAVFTYEQKVCRLDYHVNCDAAWRTVSASIAGWLGGNTVRIQVEADSERRWRLNGAEQPGVMGCIDVDLNFSPSTNLIPIRRLKLAVNERIEVTAAWLRFPEFTLEPLQQQYARLDESTVRYASAGGQFVADLKVNRAGFVVDYPGIWMAEVLSE